MADFKQKTQSAMQSLANQGAAKFIHIDGSVALVTVLPTTLGGRLLRVIVNTKGLSLNIRTGPRVVGIIGTAVPEGTYSHGVYCENGIQVDVGGSGGSVTLVYG